MTTEQQQAQFDRFTTKMREILLKKGDDYSNEDRLSNFKLVAAITGTTPELVALIMTAVKVARLGVLFNSKGTPNNESIEDSVLDMGNYTALLNMILNEEKDKEELSF